MKSTKKSTLWKAKLLPLVAVLSMAGVRTAGAADYPSTILADNPSAYYRFEELPGATTAVDSSVNGVNAAIYPNNESVYPQLGLPGIDTNSFLFSGGGFADFAFVDIPGSSLITPPASAPFSCELWVQPTGQPATYSVPIEVAQFPNGWNFYVSGADANGGTSYFYLNMPNGVLFQGFPDFPISFPSIWYHLVITYNGAGSVRVYINNVAHGPYNVAYSPAVNSDAHVGSGQGVGWLPFIGGIDEVAFYTNVLSAGQIQTHYQVGTNSFRLAFTKPSIASGPASTTNYSGLPVSFSVTPGGTPPLHYKWFKNSTPIGADANPLTFTSQYPADNNANIQVIITNNYGSITSMVATLTVLTNDNIPGPPSSITRNVGSYAVFYVTAFGAAPITYQWSQSINGGGTFTPIAGATSAALWLTNVQPSQSGYQYAVTVNGPFSSTLVPAATLTVQPRAVNVPLTGYGAVVAADQPVAYWRLDETTGAATAVDAVGSFDGFYTPNVGSITYGVLPPGIPNDTDPAATIANGATIQVPFAPELNPTTPWSVETWVQPSSLAANGGDYRVVLSSEYNLFPNPYNGWYIYQQPNGTFAFVPQPGNVFLSAGSLVANNWYYLVVTDDGTNFKMYINGVLAVAPLPVAGANFIPNGAGVNPDGTAGITPGLGNTVLGQRTDGAFNTFEGTIDDTAIYKYALSPQQIQNHFLNTTRLSVASSGNNIVVSWPVGTLQSSTNVSGPYVNVGGATSPYTNSVSGAQKFFRVQLQ
ncbi:MAG TPA: LamG domain-containing protein [Verrucomicrobiae bacterium]|nr:LamG domain-containing protein [Verrucomicrobiae bacterium]